MVLQRKRERERENDRDKQTKTENDRERERERERLSINLCAYPYTLRNQGGAEILLMSYFSSSSDFLGLTQK